MNDETIAKILALVEDIETAAYGLGTERDTNNSWVCADYETRIDKATGEIEALLRSDSALVGNNMSWPAVTVDQLKSGDCFEDPSTGRIYVVQDISESEITPGFFYVSVRRSSKGEAMRFGYGGYSTVYKKED